MEDSWAVGLADQSSFSGRPYSLNKFSDQDFKMIFMRLPYYNQQRNSVDIPSNVFISKPGMQ